MQKPGASAFSGSLCVDVLDSQRFLGRKPALTGASGAVAVGHRLAEPARGAASPCQLWAVSGGVLGT